MKRIWIIGGGRFGGLTIERLSGGRTPPELTIVDPDESRGIGPGRAGRTIRVEDGIRFLADRLGNEPDPDWIVPALPRHLVAEWLCVRLGADRLRRIPVPESLERELPHPFRGESGDMYVSFADFLCPDDCPEPASACTVTGRPRKANLFDRIAELDGPELPVRVVRSHQLAPGVGGVRPARLAALLRDAKRANGPFVVATACRCHGVLTALHGAGPE